MEGNHFLLICSIFIAVVTAQYRGFSPNPKPIIKSLHITSDIKYTYAKTLVSSRILNPASVAQEVHFSVLLPEDAFITGLKMKIQDEVLEAYIREKEEAKNEYNAAVNRGEGAAHVSQDSRHSKLFTVSVNVQANGKVNFNLTYEELLPRKNKTYTNEINVNPSQIVDDLLVVVNIEDILKIINVNVPEFNAGNDVDSNALEKSSVTVSSVSPNKVKVVWNPSVKEQKELNKEGLNGKMLVKYDVDSSANPQQILVDNDGYFVHILRNDQLEVLDKHVIFVLDVSGSMAGDKLKQLKDAMKKILLDLSESDHFSILLFAKKVIAWGPNTPLDLFTLNGWNDDEPANVMPKDDHIVPVTKTNIKAALKFLRHVGVYSATNIMGALRNGLNVAKLGKDIIKNSEKSLESMIIFLTDGEPNIEESNPDKIIENVESQNNGVTIFSLGFGSDADMKFLKKLSIGNHGFARKIYEDADASLQLQNFYREIASPVLSDIKFEYLSDQVENVTSEGFKNLFSGSEVLVLGKVKPNGTLSGELVANSKSGVERHSIPTPHIILDPKTENKPNDTSGQLEKMWAYKTVKSLLDEYDISKNDTVENKAKELALKYSFVTPLTSLVVSKPRFYYHYYHHPRPIPVYSGAPQASYAEYSVPAMMGSPGFAASSGPSPPRGVMSTRFPSYHSQGSAGGFVPVPPPPQMPSFEPAQEEDSNTDKEHSTTTATTTTTEGSSPQYKIIPYQNVKWLNQTASEDGYLVPPSSLQTSDVIALNETNEANTKCPNGNDCRHFMYCALEEFADDISKFIPFLCHIETKFVGVCCPE